MAPRTVVEYFLVCGLGPEVQTSSGIRGYHGTSAVYSPSLLDQYPPASATDRPPPPPQLPMCVLPGGVSFYPTGFITTDESSYPRSYPIILTDGDGSKIYVSCVAFRDPVDDDIAEAYRIPANSYVDKCICLVSHSPCFRLFAEALEELHRLCFSPSGSSKPLWDIVAHMVTSIPLPTPGQTQILFSLESRLMCLELPPKDGFPHADMSFQPLFQCLDVDNVLQLFAAVLLERRVLLRANKYSLLTMVAEAICHLIYPIKFQHVYIPVLFYAGVEYIEAPTPYLMGLHLAVDISHLMLDGVVVVDLETNLVLTSEAIPPLPEPELAMLRRDLMRLLYPNVVHMDRATRKIGDFGYDDLRLGNKRWNEQHDLELRLIFLKFFASILIDYRKFVGSAHASLSVFNTQAFLKKRARTTGRQPDPIVVQLVSSQGFYDFLERGYGAPHLGLNLVDKLQNAISNGESSAAILPPPCTEPEIITVTDVLSKNPAARSRFCYDRFPANVRTDLEEEKRASLLSAASANFERPVRPGLPATAISPGGIAAGSSRERAAERDRMVLDIKVKLQGLWIRLLDLSPAEDTFGSFEYGTILALIESDAEGIGGSGFVECVREHIHSGWQCRVLEEHFFPVRELIKTTVNRATSRNDMETVRDALEISAEIHRKSPGGLVDFVQRHLGTLPVWDDIRFWDGYFESIMERSSEGSGIYTALVTDQLAIIARHLAGLKIPDPEAWFIIESIAQKNNLGSKQLIKLRGILTHVQHVKQEYWGKPPPTRTQTVSYSQDPQDDEDNQRSEAAGAGRSWVQSMFSRDRATLQQPVNNFRGRVEASPLGGSAKQPQQAGVKRAAGLRVLRGHTASVTALHVGTKSEMGDLVAENDPGFFISGSADCTVKIWDPTVRGSEFKGTLEGHTGTVRALSSDRKRIISGADDHLVIVWDKSTSQLQMQLKGHNGQVTCIRMLSEERILSASTDGTVKMWDARTDACVATIGRSSSAVLCMDFDDSSRILAAAGMDGLVHVWDVRAGKQLHKLTGHKKWIRSLRLVKDTIVTGSEDWTARVWSVSRGACDAVLACHAGGISCVEYSACNEGIITGSADGMVRIWEHQDGMLQCVKNVGVHVSPILSVKAADRWLAIGAADNSMSLFYRAEQREQSRRIAGWQLYRTPQRSAAVVRCVACDADRGRICSGGRNGLLRLWEPNLAS